MRECSAVVLIILSTAPFPFWASVFLCWILFLARNILCWVTKKVLVLLLVLLGAAAVLILIVTIYRHGYDLCHTVYRVVSDQVDKFILPFLDNSTQEQRAAGPDVATLDAILKLMERGDSYLRSQECELARQFYALAVARAEDTADFIDIAEIARWQLFKAKYCLGRARLPGTTTKDSNRCAIKALRNSDLMEDFEAVVKGVQQNVKHWDKWFKLFRLSKSSCSRLKVKKAYRRLMLQYHPDKFDGPKHCATEMSFVLAAGRELLEGHSACDVH